MVSEPSSEPTPAGVPGLTITVGTRWTTLHADDCPMLRRTAHAPRRVWPQEQPAREDVALYWASEDNDRFNGRRVCHTCWPEWSRDPKGAVPTPDGASDA